MPLQIQTSVGPMNLSDGAQSVAVRQGQGGQLMVDSVHGKYHESARRGRVFFQTVTPLGLALPIYTATALGGGGLPIWNPPNSGVNVVPLFYSWGRASGTAAVFQILLMARRLDAIATGAIMTALAEVAPFNGTPFGGQAAKTRSSNAGTNTVTAGVAGDALLTLGATGIEADATANLGHTEKFEFDGCLSIAPGTLIYIAATLASVALYGETICWEEVPV